MFGFRLAPKKCTFCNKRFDNGQIPKWVPAAGGKPNPACSSCADALGVNPPVNVIAHPLKLKKLKEESVKTAEYKPQWVRKDTASPGQKSTWTWVKE